MIQNVDELKQIVRNYLHINKQIKEKQAEEKSMRTRKKILEEKICEFMQQHQIEDINSSSGRINLKIRENYKSLSQKKTITSIQDFYRSDSQTAENLINYLLNTREKKQTKSLRILKPKKNKKMIL